MNSRENHLYQDRQHGQPVVAAERVQHIHLPPFPTTPTTGHVSVVSLLHTQPQLFDRSVKQHIRPLLPIP